MTTDELYASPKYAVVPQSLKDNHRRCAKCGEEMRLTRTVSPQISFNRRTGAQTRGADVITLLWVCQFGGEGHDVVSIP